MSGANRNFLPSFVRHIDRSMDPKKAATAYPALKRRIVEILIANDPSGLFGLGAPYDEHDRDVHIIISKLQGATGTSDVEIILEEVLGGWMDSAGEPVTGLCAAMAPDIWEAWQDFKNAAGWPRS
jgi:hypothetical protein